MEGALKEIAERINGKPPRLEPLAPGDTRTRPQADESDFENAHDKNS